MVLRQVWRGAAAAAQRSLSNATGPSGAARAARLALPRGAAVAAVAATAVLLAGATAALPANPAAAEAAGEPLPAQGRRRISLRPKRTPGESHYTYVVVGSGTAAYTALESIRQSAKSGETILLVSDEQHMARLDVNDGPEQLNDMFLDVYNEWRRHIACRLGADDQTRVVGPGGANVRKWGTRRDSQPGPSSSEDTSRAVSVLVEDLSEIALNPEEKSMLLSDGSTLTYDRCLLAPPGKPRELYVLTSNISFSLKDKINTLKDAQDFKDLEGVALRGGQKIVVIGGGYLGTTLCAALAQLNHELKQPNLIVQTFVESSPLQQYFPDYLCNHITQVLTGNGLHLSPDRLVTAVARGSEDSMLPTDEDGELTINKTTASDEREKENEKVQVTLMQGTFKEVLDDCDYVVLASTNVDPDVEIAKRSRLEIDRRNGGIVCNSSLEAYHGLFVAGSSASFFDPVLGRRRVDFYDNALNSGLLAGQNMCSEDGRLRRYAHQPTFRCTLPGTGFLFEAVGQINSNDSTVGVWLSKRDASTGRPLQETAFERGIVFYLRNNIVVGILCCNASECLEASRDILREQLTYEEASRRVLLAPDQWIRVIKTK